MFRLNGWACADIVSIFLVRFFHDSFRFIFAIKSAIFNKLGGGHYITSYNRFIWCMKPTLFDESQSIA